MIRPQAGRCAGPLHQPRGLSKGPHLVCSHLSGLLHPPHTVRVSLRGPQRFMHPGKIPPCVCLALRAARQQLLAKCHLCLQLGKQVPNQSPDSPQSPPGPGRARECPTRGFLTGEQCAPLLRALPALSGSQGRHSPRLPFSQEGATWPKQEGALKKPPLLQGQLLLRLADWYRAPVREQALLSSG